MPIFAISHDTSSISTASPGASVDQLAALLFLIHIHTVICQPATCRDLLLPDHSNDAAIQAIGKKAEELCIQPGLDVPVPGAAASLHHMVPSKSGAAPHFVKTPPTLTGQFICDDRCLNYKTYKICSHTVAVAESNGKLRELISWYKKNKSINWLCCQRGTQCSACCN